MKEIYLDNNATTPVAPEIALELFSYFSKYYGNPSSLHRLGVKAERAVNKARRCLSRLLRVGEQEIVFTSGGTESVNLAIKGVAQAMKRHGNHIVTSSTEHNAVLASISSLKQLGFSVDFVGIDSTGKVVPETVSDLIKSDTILVAMMHINNELGTINPINNIARAVKAKNKQTIFFSDGAQAFGKQEIDLTDIDLYSISGHKFHASKGSGVLYVKDKTPLQPLISGGGQERGLRSGTENVEGIIGLAKAAELAYSQLANLQKRWQKLRTCFVRGLKSLPDVVINSPSDALKNTINVSFGSIPSEVMMHLLEEKGVYVSTGSACGGMKRKPSHVLKAFGLSAKRIQSAIRFSFSRYNTDEEIEYTLKCLNEILGRLKTIIK